jgi:IclR family acetate operon transcriptional repressor
MGLSELARETGQSKSTVHGLIHTLVHLGWVEAAGDAKGYQPASALVDLWREALLKGPLAQAAKPLLAAFSEEHGLTTLAGVFIQSRVLVVQAVLAPGFSISAYPGQWLPVWAPALGKALLASIPQGRMKRLARPMADRGPLDRRTFLAHVEAARAEGVALDREEYLSGVRALAALIPPLGSLEPQGAVWAVGFSSDLSDARMATLAPRIKRLAETVGRDAARLRENAR